MQKKYSLFYVFIGLLLFVMILISYRAITYSGGPNGGLTNAPGENNCTSCHSGSLITSGTNWNNMSLTTDIPLTGYLPDSVYSITLSHSQSGIGTWGFQITVLQTSNNNMAGSFTITNSVKTQKKTSGSKEYVTHTSSGTSGSGSNSWSFSWKAPSSNVGDVKFYAVVNAANGNGMTSGDQIYAKTWTFSVSSLLPTAVINASKTNICVGDTLFLSGSGNNNPTGFEWSMPGGTPSSSTSQNPFVVYSTSGLKTITLVTKNAKGKSLPATINITVNSLPPANITVNGKTTFCPGDSVMLTAPSGSGYSYFWSTGEKTRSIYVKTAGNFHVTVTNSSGCSSTSQDIKTSVFQVSSNNLSASDDSICSGSFLSLYSTTGFSSYSFYNGNNLIGTGKSNSLQLSSLTSGNDLYVVAIDSNGCQSVSNHLSVAVVQAEQAPAIRCGNKTTSSVTFIWDKKNDIKYYEISKDTGKTWINIGMDTFYQVSGLSYSTDVLLQMRASDYSPCGLTQTATHVCQSEPCSPISFQINRDSLICMGDSALVSISGIGTSKYAINFNGMGYLKDTVYYVKPKVSTNYIINIIDSAALNCPPIVKNIWIEVEKFDLKLSDNLDSGQICEGQTVFFEATKGLVEYHFFQNGNPVKSGNDNIWTSNQFSDHDQIFVSGISAQGCMYFSDTQNLTVFPKPNIQLISDKNNHLVCRGEVITFTASKTFIHYDFILNQKDTLYSGILNEYTYHQPSDNDLIFVHAIDQHGCEVISQPIQIKVRELPLPGFTFTQNNLTFIFTDTTKNIISRKWDFGDMQEDTARTVQHTYNSEGKYQVKLSVTDNYGCHNLTEQEIEAIKSGIDLKSGKVAYFKATVNQQDKKLILDYYLPQTEMVEVSLINTAGQMVKTLSTGESDAGNHRKIFGTEDLPSGIFIIRIQTLSGVFSQKVVLP